MAWLNWLQMMKNQAWKCLTLNILILYNVKIVLKFERMINCGNEEELYDGRWP